MDNPLTESMIPKVLSVLTTGSFNITYFGLSCGLSKAEIDEMDEDAKFLGRHTFCFLCLILYRLYSKCVPRDVIPQALVKCSCKYLADQLNECRDWTDPPFKCNGPLSNTEIRDFLYENSAHWMKIGVYSGIPVSCMLSVNLDGMPTCENKIRLIYDKLLNYNLFDRTSALIQAKVV